MSGFPCFAVRWHIGHVVLVTFWYFGVVVLFGGCGDGWLMM